MTLYIGVDFHPHQQTVCWCDSDTGETRTIDLKHDREIVREFYASLPEGAVIGVEASARARWFEKLVADTGHRLFVGNPVLIRKRATSRHKNDRRDAELILGLLMRGEFPVLWRRPAESDRVLEVIRLRHNLVRQRTGVYNRLQALAHDAGLPKGRMRTAAFQNVLKEVEMDEAAALVRSHLFRQLGSLTAQISEIENWLKAKAALDGSVALLLSQPGVGYLSALATVHTVGDVTRFTRLSKQVVSFVGLDPLERSSAGRKSFGSVSKAGSPLLRYQLGMSAVIATRFDKELKAFHKRLAKKKAKAVAKVAAARKLLVKLAIMLRDKITAQEFDQRGRTVGNARLNARSEMTVL